jgi:hypothetical protein
VNVCWTANTLQYSRTNLFPADRADLLKCDHEQAKDIVEGGVKTQDTFSLARYDCSCHNHAESTQTLNTQTALQGELLSAEEARPVWGPYTGQQKEAG